MERPMTWEEFKAHVDKLLDEKGIDPNSEIHYIDISNPEASEIGDESGYNAPNVFYDAKQGIAIQ